MQLSQKKARFNQFLALLFTSIIGLCYFLLIWSVEELSDTLYYIFLIGGAMACYSCYRIFTKKYRERKELSQTPFPEAWKKILHRYVTFYRALNEEEKARFETEIQIFIHEKGITGIKTEIDDTTRLLVAASAMIPVFGFPEWEYDNLGEVLIYPDAFNKSFQTQGERRHVLGMVGRGVMNGTMILSKPALLAGFKINTDKHNVGIHEFVHLLDASDGQYDGIPENFLDHQYLDPWLRVMHEEMERIKAGNSSINPYAATNPAEFFAVTAEYFFERPDALKKDQPELYNLLMRVFHQNTKNRLQNALRSTLNYRGRRVGRNDECPCGSGEKYKDCCRKNRSKQAF